MADISNTSPDFLSQVSALAPTVAQLINSKTGRITAAVTSHDVTGGYGRGFTLYLKLELLVEQCLSCFETQFSQPTFDCRWHRFEKRFMQVADAEAPTLEKAMVKLEAAMAIRIEHPPLSALTEGEPEPTAAEKLQAEIGELIDAFKDSGGDDKKIASEIKRRLTAFNAVRIGELNAGQLQELKDGLSFWLNSQKVTA